MFTSKSAADTEAAGLRIAGALQANEVIALCGDLGSGKTQLVKGIARGLAITAPVTSPTFTLVHEYRGGRLPLFHFDFYRLQNVAELRALGWEEYLEADGVTAVEWADRFPEAMPPATKWIRLAFEAGDRRTIDLGKLQ